MTADLKGAEVPDEVARAEGTKSVDASDDVRPKVSCKDEEDVRESHPDEEGEEVGRSATRSTQSDGSDIGEESGDARRASVQKTIRSVASFLAEAEQEVQSARGEDGEENAVSAPRGRLGSLWSGFRFRSPPIAEEPASGKASKSRARAVSGRSSDGAQAGSDSGSDVGDPAAVSEAGGRPPLESVLGAAGGAVGLRFHMFNMANAAELRPIEMVQGPQGIGGLGDIFHAPMKDGAAADVVFVALPEAPLDGRRLQTWCEENRLSSSGGRSGERGSSVEPNRIVVASAKSESARDKSSRVLAFVENRAGDVNGDLKTMLAYKGQRFVEDGAMNLFGLLTDIVVAGIAVPNPKKSFVGRCVQERGMAGCGLRMAFVGAHFPITDISEILESEEPGVDALECTKRIFAGVLRQVLRRASRTSLLDDRTVLFVQGDLNSRTVLQNGKVHDVLQEVLKDRLLQKAIAHNLPDMPAGRWRELVPHEEATALPVTYKFRRKKVEAATTREKEQPSTISASSSQEEPVQEGHLTVGDVVEQASAARRMEKTEEPLPMEHRPDTYRQLLMDAGEAMRNHWDIAFKAKDFRPFRFPASADRIVYWAPDKLKDRISFDFPHGGYKVNHKQGGSDHKPVCLEAILRVAPASLEPTVEDGTEEWSDHDAAHLSAILDDSGDSKRDSKTHMDLGREGRDMRRLNWQKSLSESAVDALLDEKAQEKGEQPEDQVGLKASWGKSKAGVGWNWTPDSEATQCEICDMGFTLFRRRHHCRVCGICVCGSCSPPEGMRPLPELGIDVPCRVCTRCAAQRGGVPIPAAEEEPDT